MLNSMFTHLWDMTIIEYLICILLLFYHSLLKQSKFSSPLQTDTVAKQKDTIKQTAAVSL